MEREYQICKRCVMDTTDSEIVFDKDGYCNHCTNALIGLNRIGYFNPEQKRAKLDNLFDEIKNASQGKKYNCLIGLSGGIDSSYLAYILVKEFGLNPLAVHVDNGWNSELSVKNIETIVNRLGIDLYTYVIDWGEFKDLQLAYLRASVLDIEVLTDNAIVVAIENVSNKYRIKHFLCGFNYGAESIMPSSWLYSPKYDSLNIRSIYKKYGSGKKLKTYPLLSNFWAYAKYRFFNKQLVMNVLDLLDYKKEVAIDVLKNELNWREYGGKHFESIITRFYQSYILPRKFNVDKRRAHLSSLICSGQISREQAMEELEEPIYIPEMFNTDKEFFLKKLGLNQTEFEGIMNEPPKSHFEYPAYNRIINKIGLFKGRLHVR